MRKTETQPDRVTINTVMGTFKTWAQAIAHATQLKMHGKISRCELNDVKTAAREAGHDC
jgi:hypothetical protein